MCALPIILNLGRAVQQSTFQEDDSLTLGDYLVYFPILLLIAWLVGEVSNRFGLPRIVAYGGCGLIAGVVFRLFPVDEIPDLTAMADAAMGLLLFELGYRLNPAWLLRKPIVLLVSLVESSLTFLAVFVCCAAFSVQIDQSLAIAAVCIATSPGAVLQIVREKQSSGQVTNFLLTFSALSCLTSILVFKLISCVFLIFAPTSDAIPGAILWGISVSIFSGVLTAGMLHATDRLVQFSEDAKAFTIALATICLAMILHQSQYSPALGCLALGLTIRRSGMKVTGKLQDFGSLGRMSVLFLFVYLSSRLGTKHLLQGIPVGIAIVAVRTIIKTLLPLQFATALGCGKRKALMVGIGMWPVSAYAMAILEQGRNMGVDLLGSCPPIIAVIAILEILGPIATSVAVDRSHEATTEG